MEIACSLLFLHFFPFGKKREYIGRRPSPLSQVLHSLEDVDNYGSPLTQNTYCTAITILFATLIYIGIHDKRKLGLIIKKLAYFAFYNGVTGSTHFLNI